MLTTGRSKHLQKAIWHPIFDGPLTLLFKPAEIKSHKEVNRKLSKRFGQKVISKCLDLNSAIQSAA
jgi:hypothetical protein